MRREHLNLLVCPECRGPLDLLPTQSDEEGRIESGSLGCPECSVDYPIIRHVPRFVPLENYASGFGLEWMKHPRTQYDSYSGANVSETRFFEETKWPRDLSGELILEVGCGAGRFTEQAVSTNAMVVSMDYSYAVEANHASHGKCRNVLIVQADLYKMPFPRGFFDRLFCFGVLQHTPDVERAFASLPGFLKRGGSIAVDVYRKFPPPRQMLITKYWLRPITKRMDPALLYRITSRYVKLMWPLVRLISKIPGGTSINWALLVADHRGTYPLGEETLREWAILDTFDMLSPVYDQPQTIETVRKWIGENGLVRAEVQHGYNGIEARAVKP